MDYIYTSRIGQSDLEVYEAGTQQCVPGFSFGPVVRDMFLIHFIHSGKGTFRSAGGECYTVGPGQLFLIEPDIVHTYSADEEDPWHYSWIGFVGSLASILTQEAGLSGNASVKRPENRKAVEALFGQMMECGNEPAKELMLTGLLYQLLGKLADNGDRLPARADIGGHVRKAVEFMNVHFAGRIGLDTIAAHVGLDGKYLCRLFQKEMDMSPYRYLTEVRMRKACRLLRRNALSVSEIARSVGYADALLFSRMFKKNVGMSPSAYRLQALAHGD